MKMVTLIFAGLAYSILAGFIVNSTVPGSDIEFPVLDVPEFEFIDVSGGCAGFTDCTEYLANIIKNIGSGIISGVQLLFNLIAFLLDIIAILLSFSTGIQGAPWYVNAMIVTPGAASVAIITYKMIRSGRSDD